MDEKVCYSLIGKHQTLADGERQLWDRWQSWMEGEFYATIPDDTVSPTAVSDMHLDNSDLNFETNTPFAFIDTMKANVCPSNPQVTVNCRMEETREAGKKRETLINDTMRRIGFNNVLRMAATHTAISGRCPIKTVWSTRKKMPIVICVDPRAFFYDKSLPFDQTRYVIEARPLTLAEFNRRKKRGSEFGFSREAAKQVTASGYPKWLKPLKGTLNKEDDEARDELKWVLTYEFWDLDEGHYYQFAENVEKPLLHLKELPYTHISNPYDLLVFNQSTRNSGGISDIKLIAKALERMNELDTIELDYAHKSIPIVLTNDALLDSPDAFKEALSRAGPMDTVSFRTTQPVAIDNVIGFTKTPDVLVNFEIMRERCNSTINYILGFPEYARGKTNTSEVATELALVDTATRTRNGMRVDTMGGLVTRTAMKIGALWQQFMPESQQIPVQLDADAGDFAIVDRESLLFDGDPIEHEFGVSMWENSWYYDFEVVSFSPTENHRLVQLNKLVQFDATLQADPYTDQSKLSRKRHELLGTEELYDPEGGNKQMLQQQAMQKQMPNQMPSGTPADAISTGQMPDGADVEDMNASDPRAMAG
jgi:hypothetical protein